ncbi:hypothetical protein ACFY2H_19455 [Streptomyces griseofuscus]|uniref:Uncharacterized protein n=2 Tax=Streptomyces griseofuscus TaxID=146922 RepID=A0A7H1Q0W3_9ACTN|nr:hypothetical protein [Streptomyces griseofuscus]QNT93943.1 hypothetical protein HEP81_03644 [Streptomyces griseofuscus]BBC94610.1 hypothetical protein SRO_3434 [Streptomyces rochei]
MRDGGPQWTLTVPTGGDTLRQERLTRDLHNTLERADGLVVGFHDADGPAEPGRKGAGVGEVALWAATTATVVRPASQVLITLIKEWCAKERHRKVVVTIAGDSIEITGRPDAAQERMVREFQDRISGNDGTEPDDSAP